MDDKLLLRDDRWSISVSVANQSINENLEESACGVAEQDIRALAGLPVGRVGSLFSCAPSLSFALFFCISFRSPLFTFAEYLARSPFLPSSLPLFLSDCQLTPSSCCSTVLLLL